MQLPLYDSLSNIECVLNPHSSCSLYPEENTELTNCHSALSLYIAATKSVVTLYSLTEKTIKIGQNNYTWQFYTARTDFILLGSDFLQQYNIHS